MKIGDLNVGDLVTWTDRVGRSPNDLGIVLDVEPCTAARDRIALAVIYWREEDVHIHTCDGSELDDWFGRGVLEVRSENR